MTISNHQKPNSTTMEQLVIKERLRQARLSFNLALGLTLISAIISLAGIGLLLSGKISEGTATTAGGISAKIVGVGLLKMTKDTNERLDKIAIDFQDDD